MPIYNMQCPKCGKSSTEYDLGKWKCLHCDNKFVLVPETPAIKVFNFQSKALFNVLPDNSIPFQGVMDNMKVDEEEFDISLIHIRNWMCGLLTVLFSLIWLSFSWFLSKPEFLTNWSWVELSGYIAILVILSIVFYLSYQVSSLCSFCFMFLLYPFLRFTPYVNRFLIPSQYNSYCPYCNTVYEEYFDDESLSNASNLGLVHCLNCGTQFFIRDGRSYQIDSK